LAGFLVFGVAGFLAEAGFVDAGFATGLAGFVVFGLMLTGLLAGRRRYCDRLRRIGAEEPLALRRELRAPGDHGGRHAIDIGNFGAAAPSRLQTSWRERENYGSHLDTGP
jgi:hypothetical protein